MDQSSTANRPLILNGTNSLTDTRHRGHLGTLEDLYKCCEENTIRHHSHDTAHPPPPDTPPPRTVLRRGYTCAALESSVAGVNIKAIAEDILASQTGRKIFLSCKQAQFDLSIYPWRTGRHSRFTRHSGCLSWDP